MSDTFIIGFVARALVAAQAGKHDLARGYVATLSTLQPAWRDDPYRQAKRSFPADEVAGRVAHDLMQISGNIGE